MYCVAIVKVVLGQLTEAQISLRSQRRFVLQSKFPVWGQICDIGWEKGLQKIQRHQPLKASELLLLLQNVTFCSSAFRESKIEDSSLEKSGATIFNRDNI